MPSKEYTNKSCECDCGEWNPKPVSGNSSSTDMIALMSVLFGLGMMSNTFIYSCWDEIVPRHTFSVIFLIGISISAAIFLTDEPTVSPHGTICPKFRKDRWNPDQQTSRTIFASFISINMTLFLWINVTLSNFGSRNSSRILNTTVDLNDLISKHSEVVLDKIMKELDWIKIIKAAFRAAVDQHHQAK
ncbi:uncharacterized protein L201_005621 [Kwoniella dendrophila CBS 6074]|uniref:Uncharacterized protein n=1 Tax=Kwoniella dendrophila CBS 6074 TaxID=1295534 RepID=A0AAX4K0M7_9TREE